MRVSFKTDALVALFFLTLPTSFAQVSPSPTYDPPSPTQGQQTSSPSSSPNPQWSTVLGNSLWFYDAQRSGKLDQGAYGNRVSWRNDSGLDDGKDWGLDLTGGWYDAGDYIKTTYPLGFTMFSLAWGALSYGPGFDTSHQTAYIDGTLRWGYDWLMKCHPKDDVLFVQVGSTDIDNGSWRGDRNLSQPRPSYPVNSSAPGTDAWASTAAAFALGALTYAPDTKWNTSDKAYGPASLGNNTYSGLLLGHAKTLYSTAKSSPQKRFMESIPEIGSAYISSGFEDDLTIAALSLAAATNDSSYYSDAYDYYKKFALSGKNMVWNWDSRSPAIYVLFAEMSVARPGLAAGAGLDVNVTGWQKEAERMFDVVINGGKGPTLTGGGLLFYPGDSDQASLNPALAMAALMLRYAPIASSPDKARSYRDFANRQVDYVLGFNPMYVPYVVGTHPNSPKNPHSAMAVGTADMNNLRTNPPENEHILFGAVIGGPLKSDKYWDYRDDWVQNEVALDYNANLPAIAALNVANNTGDPYYVGITTLYQVPEGKPCDAALTCRGGLSGGAIAGIVIGVIVALVIAVFFAWYFLMRKR